MEKEKPPRFHYQDEGFANMAKLPIIDDELLNHIQSPIQLADLAASYISRQVMFNTQIVLGASELDKLFKVIQDVAEENTKYIFNFVLDYHNHMRSKGGDMSLPNHAPVIWLLTELLKLYMEPVSIVALCLKFLLCFVELEDNIRWFIDYHTVGVILGSMAAHVNSCDVQKFSCNILAHLAKYLPEKCNSKALVREAAIEITLQSISNFPDELEVLIPACVTIATATVTLRAILLQSADKTTPVHALHEEALTFFQHRCTPTVQQMLMKHTNCYVIQRECERFLQQFADSTSPTHELVLKSPSAEEKKIDILPRSVSEQYCQSSQEDGAQRMSFSALRTDIMEGSGMKVCLRPLNLEKEVDSQNEIEQNDEIFLEHDHQHALNTVAYDASNSEASNNAPKSGESDTKKTFTPNIGESNTAETGFPHTGTSVNVYNCEASDSSARISPDDVNITITRDSVARSIQVFDTNDPNMDGVITVQTGVVQCCENEPHRTGSDDMNNSSRNANDDAPHTGADDAPHTSTDDAPHTGTDDTTHTSTDDTTHTSTDDSPHTGTVDAPQTGTDDVPQTGTDDSPHTDTDDAPHTGTDDAPHTGTDDVPHTGTDDAPQTGTDDVPQTGTDDSPHTGTDNAPHTGTDDVPHTGTDDAPHKGTDDAPHTSTDDAPHTGTDDAPHTGTDDAPQTGGKKIMEEETAVEHRMHTAVEGETKGIIIRDESVKKSPGISPEYGNVDVSFPACESDLEEQTPTSENLQNHQFVTVSLELGSSLCPDEVINEVVVVNGARIEKTSGIKCYSDDDAGSSVLTADNCGVLDLTLKNDEDDGAIEESTALTPIATSDDVIGVTPLRKIHHVKLSDVEDDSLERPSDSLESPCDAGSTRPSPLPLGAHFSSGLESRVAHGRSVDDVSDDGDGDDQCKSSCDGGSDDGDDNRLLAMPGRSISCPGLAVYYQSFDEESRLADDDLSEEDDDYVDNDGLLSPTRMPTRRAWGSIHPPDIEGLLANRTPSMVAESLESDTSRIRLLHMPPSHSDPNICRSLDRKLWSEMPLRELLYLEEKSLESRSTVSEVSSGVDSEADEEGILDYLISEPHNYMVQVLVCRTQVLLYVLSYWDRKRYLTVFDILGRPVLRVLEDVRLPAEIADFARGRQSETVLTSFVSVLGQMARVSGAMKTKMLQKLLASSEKLLVQPIPPTLTISVCESAGTIFKQWKNPDKKSMQSLAGTVNKVQNRDDVDDEVRQSLHQLLAMMEQNYEK